MGKHNSGPWAVTDNTPDGSYGPPAHAKFIIRDNERWCIAAVISDVRSIDAEANAALIAAAPEAVPLAKAVAAHFEGTDSPLGKMARDWLAKAKGERHDQ